MAVNIDIVEGTASSHDLARGWTVTRIAIVTGLDTIATTTLTGTLTSGSTTVTGISSTAGLYVGQTVSGTGIPVTPLFCEIASIVSSSSITLTWPATASGAKTLTFGSLDTTGIIKAAENAVIKFLAAEQPSYVGDASHLPGDRGTPLPNIGVGTFLESFQTELLSANIAKVKIIYKGHPLPTFEFDSSLGQIETNKDVNGNPITVSYTWPSTDHGVYPDGTARAGTTQPTGGLVSKAVPESTYIIKFLITSGTISGSPATATQILALYKSSWEGCINSGSVTMPTSGGVTYAPHFVLCEKISGMSRDGGLTYEATAVFHAKAGVSSGGFGPWDPTVTFISPDTGLPPSDVQSQAGTATMQVQVIPATDFSSLFASNLWGPN